jgi:hypothetical protein
MGKVAMIEMTIGITGTPIVLAEAGTTRNANIMVKEMAEMIKHRTPWA